MASQRHYKTSIIPGKTGGTFSLPFNASITVPAGSFGKKDTLTCRVATPQTRWHACPAHLPTNEHVNSEIYTLTSSIHHLKKNAIICIPFNLINYEFNEINVKVKWTGHIEWANVGFVIKELDDKPYVELDVSKLGTFLVTTKPKTETFDVTPQGCLYQARLSRHITIRFPKKTIAQDIQCTLQIIPISAEKVQLSKEQHLTDSAHITAVTEFIDVITNVPCRFARPVTIKLPLPMGVELDGEDKGDAVIRKRHQDIAVLYKTNTGWELVESPFKFTRTTVCFDVKEMSRFCVMQCVPGRQKKMKEAITLLEGRSEKEKGEVCIFLSIRNKSWLALVEVFPKHLAGTKISTRISQGFTVGYRTQGRQAGAAPFRFSSRRPQMLTKNTPLADSDESFELYEGLTWMIGVDGDVKVSVQSDLRENAHLRYFARLKDSFRTFFFEPPDMDPRPLEAYVNLVPIGLKDESFRDKLTFTFKIEIEESTMVEYLVPDSPRETVPGETPLEKPKEPILDVIPETPKKEVAPPPPSTPMLKEQPINVMRRLTTIKKPVTIPERESRAITGRSLMTLARLVPEGLTLAVHLQLPDSTITGIGFDALSNNLNMSDVSYKILLHWKRKCKDKQMGAIRQLTDALRQMNYHVVAEAIFNCHLRHKEFTQDCISMSPDEDFMSVTAL